MDLKALIGLVGVVIAALTAEFNDGVSGTALPDIRGGLGIDIDQGTWLTTLYAIGQVIGMSLSPWWAVTMSVRRWVLFAIGLCCVSTIFIPFTSSLTLLYGLRFLQGLSGGFIIPCLLIVGLRVLAPSIRLYGLALYALTATFGPNMATTLAALWTDVVAWQFVFFEALPLCALASLLVWYGVEQDAPKYERVALFDWPGALLGAIGFSALITMLEQGDRYDWFNSRTICVLALVSVVALPLFVINEFLAPSPLFGFALLKRRNLAYGLITLFTFLLIGQSASTIPNDFLVLVQGFRPIQAYAVTLVVAASQLVLLPLVAVLLNFKHVDSRVVSFAGLACVLTACAGNIFLTSVVQGGGFLIWQGLQAVGEPMIVLPLLMMSTNEIKKPEEGPLGSALINTCRGLAEPVGAWLIALIMRWRGGLHTSRILDQSGQGSTSVIAGPAGLIQGNPPPLLPDGQPRFAGSLDAFIAQVQVQSRVMSLSDSFAVFGGLVVFLMIVLAVLPVRTYPPRIALAKK